MAVETGPERATGTLPRRFDLSPQWARRAARTVRRFVPGDPEPTPAERGRQAEALLRGDPIADALARAVSVERTVTMDQFRTALSHGVPAVHAAPKPLVDFFAAVEARPSWVDERLLAQGADVCLRGGLTSLDILGDSSLMGGYRSSATTEVLVGTGRLVGPATNQRVADTSQWWHAVVSPGGMARPSAGWRLTVHVRLMHALVNRQFLDGGWDVDDWGLPVNQYDRAGTLALFSTSYLISLRALGVPVSRSEGRAVMHLWRYVGWLMGVDEHWLAESEGEGRRNFYHAMLLSPGPDESSRVLARSLAESHRRTGFARLTRAQQWFAYRKHLSLVRLFHGRSGMAELGLPPALPWYAAVVPVNLAGHTVVRLVPGGRRWWARRADRRIARRIAAYRAACPAPSRARAVPDARSPRA